MKYVTREDDISALEMSVRVTNCMNRIQIHTVGAFLEYPEDRFLSIRNLGKTSLEEILRIRAELIDQSSSLFRLADSKDVPTQAKANDDSEEQSVPVLLYDLPISEMKLSVRAMNCLRRKGWTMASQLVGKSLDDLLSVKYMGRKTAEEVLDAVSALSLRMSGRISKEAFSPHGDGTAALAEELANVFGGLPGSWLLKLEQLRGGEALDRDALLGLVFKEDEILFAQKKAICDYLETHEDQASIAEVIDYMRTRLADSAFTVSLIDELADEGMVLRNGSSVSRLYPDACKFAESIQDKRLREVLLARLSGKTLEEVAADYGLTRERVRQLQNKALKNVPRLREDKYRYAFDTYSFSREDFRLTFGEPDEVYQYLMIVSKKNPSGRLPLDNALDDDRIPVDMRRQMERAAYKEYVSVDGVRIPKKRTELVNVVVRRFCREDTVFQDFSDLYRMLLEDLGLSDEPSLQLESRTYENHLRDSMEVLWKPGKRFRYYNIAERDYTELLETLSLEQYQDTVLSSLLFFRQYPDLMREYDLRDEYELHNLLKKIWGAREPELNFGRNPMILFGNGSHEAQAMELLRQYSPIGWTELAEKYEEVYGMRADSVGANILGILSDYYHDGVFQISQETLSPERFDALKDRLPGDYYSLRDVERTYLKLFPDGRAAHITPYTLKTMGFHVFSGYVISKRYPSATEYFTQVLTEKDITSINELDGRMQSLGAFSGTLAELRQQRTLIEFEPHRLIHIRRLEAGGITKDRLEDYCDSVYSWLGQNHIFTIRSLREGGFAHELDDLGFDDWFYSSLLCEDPRFRSRRMGGTRLLYSGNKAITLEDLLSDILLEREKIEIYELETLLADEYDICLEKDKLVWLIKEGSLYYDNIMETVYLDYDTYFEEI